jgi:hypothetical protein
MIGVTRCFRPRKLPSFPGAAHYRQDCADAPADLQLQNRRPASQSSFRHVSRIHVTSGVMCRHVVLSRPVLSLPPATTMPPGALPTRERASRLAASDITQCIRTAGHP